MCNHGAEVFWYSSLRVSFCKAVIFERHSSSFFIAWAPLLSPPLLSVMAAFSSSWSEKKSLFSTAPKSFLRLSERGALLVHCRASSSTMMSAEAPFSFPPALDISFYGGPSANISPPFPSPSLRFAPGPPARRPARVLRFVRASRRRRWRNKKKTKAKRVYKEGRGIGLWRQPSLPPPLFGNIFLSLCARERARAIGEGAGCAVFDCRLNFRLSKARARPSHVHFQPPQGRRRRRRSSETTFHGAQICREV